MGVGGRLIPPRPHRIVSVRGRWRVATFESATGPAPGPGLHHSTEVWAPLRLAGAWFR